jgi:hypothetical protein
MITVADFAVACKQLTHEEIYELFEFDISQQLRDLIYMRAEDDTPEPVRSALNNIGYSFNVNSLKTY